MVLQGHDSDVVVREGRPLARQQLTGQSLDETLPVSHRSALAHRTACSTMCVRAGHTGRPAFRSQDCLLIVNNGFMPSAVLSTTRAFDEYLSTVDMNGQFLFEETEFT